MKLYRITATYDFQVDGEQPDDEDILAEVMMMALEYEDSVKLSLKDVGL